MLVNVMWCYFQGCGVSKRDGVLLYGMGFSVRDVVLIKGMGCYFPKWGVTFRNGLLVYGMGC